MACGGGVDRSADTRRPSADRADSNAASAPGCDGAAVDDDCTDAGHHNVHEVVQTPQGRRADACAAVKAISLNRTEVATDGIQAARTIEVEPTALRHADARAAVACRQAVAALQVQGQFRPVTQRDGRHHEPTLVISIGNDAQVLKGQFELYAVHVDRCALIFLRITLEIRVRHATRVDAAGDGAAVPTVDVCAIDGNWAAGDVVWSLIVRHGDLIRHAVDRDLHPFGSIKRLMRSDDPCTGLIGGGEQACVADRHRLHCAGQTDPVQNLTQSDGRIPGHHILTPVIGELDRVRSVSRALCSLCRPCFRQYRYRRPRQQSSDHANRQQDEYGLCDMFHSDTSLPYTRLPPDYSAINTRLSCLAQHVSVDPPAGA